MQLVQFALGLAYAFFTLTVHDLAYIKTWHKIAYICPAA